MCHRAFLKMRLATRVMALRSYLANQLKTQRKRFYKEARQHSLKGGYARTYSRQHKEQPRTQHWTQVLIFTEAPTSNFCIPQQEKLYKIIQVM